MRMGQIRLTGLIGIPSLAVSAWADWSPTLLIDLAPTKMESRPEEAGGGGDWTIVPPP